jgi:hypothetical protein
MKAYDIIGFNFIYYWMSNSLFLLYWLQGMFTDFREWKVHMRWQVNCSKTWLSFILQESLLEKNCFSGQNFRLWSLNQLTFVEIFSSPTPMTLLPLPSQFSNFFLESKVWNAFELFTKDKIGILGGGGGKESWVGEENFPRSIVNNFFGHYSNH